MDFLPWKIYLCIYLIWTGIFHSALANGYSAGKTNIEIYSIDEGLSQSWVRCLFQDSKGYIWIGTQDGLNRYDGYDFKTFRHYVHDSTTIIGNNIFSICEDREGNLWIGTENGLSKYQRKKAIFINYSHHPNNSNSISKGPVYQVLAGSQGKIWIKTIRNLESLDPNTGMFIRNPHYYKESFLPPVDYIFPLIEDRKGRIWTGTHEGLHMFDRQSNSFFRFHYDIADDNSLSNNHVRSIHEDPDGGIWIGTEKGLNKYNGKKGTFQRFFFKNETEENIFILGLFKDPQGRFWIGTNKGIYHFDERTEIFDYWKDIESVEQPGKFYSFSSFIKDRSEIIWAGGSQGVIKYDKKRINFNLYQKLTDKDPDFTSNEIIAIHVDDDGLIWLGTWGGGLNVFNRHTNEVTKYSEEHVNPEYRISNDVVSCIFEDHQGIIWVGTDKGINLYDRKIGHFTSFCSYTQTSGCEEFDHLYVNNICEDRHGNIWIATSTGLIRYTPEENRVKTFRHEPADTLSISTDFIYSILEDSDGLIWLATRAGLNCYDPQKGTFVSYQTDSYNFTGTISSNFVYSLHEDKEGILWIGTESGLNRFDRHSGEFRVYTEKDGLPNDLINAILGDDRKNLWLSTNRGLVMFNTQNGEIYTFDQKDGLQSSEYNLGSSFKSRTGELFFGGIQGFNSFYPDSIILNPFVPEVVITSFSYLSSEGGWKEIPFEEGRVTIRTRESNMLAIEFAALEFTNPQKNQYLYYLDGMEDTWQTPTTDRRIIYSHLNMGKYIFRVKGSNDDMIWNDKETTLQIQIKTTLWSSRFAYGFYIISILVLIYMFFNYRTYSLRKANRILKEKQKASLEVAKQKEELSLKNKNITDSINYARKIQEAMLPSQTYFKKLFPESFVLYRPKDIVSGDFYWIKEKKDKVFITAVDCTGHGVPGAFMSMIGFEIIAQIINDQGIEQPAEILNILSKTIEDTFSKGEEDMSLKDGMDLTFCVIDRKNKILQFAGAFNPLYLVRDNSLTEIKGERMSIGVREGLEYATFTNHVISLEKNDVIYLFSDGYADQFGGPNDKKFMYRRFRHLLLTIHSLNMKDQLSFMEESLEAWMGNQDQIDDILIIGIKPLEG